MTIGWGCGPSETEEQTRTSDQGQTSGIQQVVDVQSGPMAEPRAAPVREAMLERIDRMGTALDRFEALVEKADGSAESEARLHQAFREARRAYKETEGLIAFYFPSTADLLNMPALPHVEDEDPNEIIRPPQGFQVVEEMIFPHFDVADKKDVLAEFFYLRAAARRAQAHATAARLTDRHVFEAMRQQLIRLQAHGLVGFDSPVALASLEEASVVLEAMREDLAPYRADALERAPEAWNELDEHLIGAVAYLRSEDHTFETFDRLYFIRAFANPIMAGLRDVRAGLGIETNPARTAVRPAAASAFDEDALDPAFFAAIRSGEATPERVELGRLLFFDPVLSANNRRACASCHQPGKAFTDGLPKSTGFDFEPGLLRNAPTVINAGLQGSSAYDQTTETVEQRIRTVVENAHEMHTSLEEAADALRLSPEYVARFEAAFGELSGGDAATQRKMARGIEVALADYVRSLSSLDSPFDRYARGETDALPEAARRGFNLFMGKALCGT
ncbi:MAG: cytochrome-c peroxidase, partial [Rhodothermales bacterium]